jgi:hypothetical protein
MVKFVLLIKKGLVALSNDIDFFSNSLGLDKYTKCLISHSHSNINNLSLL